MEHPVAAVLFGLAFYLPPIAVVIGIVMLALPSRSRTATGVQHRAAHR